MRICLDLTPSIQNHAGLGRLAFETARALAALNSGDEFSLLCVDRLKRPPKPPLDTLAQRSIPVANKPWRLFVLMAHLSGLRLDWLLPPADLFHATDHLLPPLKMPSIFTLADLTFLSHASTHLPLNRWFLKLMMPRFLRQARAIITISENTRRDVCRVYRVPTDKLHVIYPGVDKRFARPPTLPTHAFRERYALPERFILYVGTIEPRKNLATLLEALRHAALKEIKLVIAGNKGWLHADTLERIKKLGLGEQVRLIGFVPDEDLPSLYGLAEAFAFPSLYEGFGLPVLEAMGCGTPVICSNTSSLPEVAGDAALLVAPTDVHGWVQVLQQITSNSTLRNELRYRGFAQAARFTWETTARQTLEVYRQTHDPSS